MSETFSVALKKRGNVFLLQSQSIRLVDVKALI